MLLNEEEIFIDGKRLGKVLESNISFTEESDPPDYITNIHPLLSASAEMSFECGIDAELFRKIAGVDLALGPDVTGYTMIGKCPYKEQIRRHKKKRINKKWAKRYGYRTKFRDVEVRDVTLIDRDNGLFEFEGRIIHG